jgi:hypothetical protein
MNNDLKKTQLRTLQYQHMDGTFELTFGGVFLLNAVCFYGFSRLEISNPSLTNGLLSFAPLVVFMGGIFLIDALVQRFRRRVTFPRTGYISYQKPKPLKRSTRLFIWIGIPVLTVITVVLLFLNRSKFPMEQNQDYAGNLIPGFFGVMFGGLYAIMGWKIALPRFFLVALVSLLVGAWLFVRGLQTYLGMAFIFGVTGVSLCISGGVTLWRYLLDTPLQEDASSTE